MISTYSMLSCCLRRNSGTQYGSQEFKKREKAFISDTKRSGSVAVIKDQPVSVHGYFMEDPICYGTIKKLIFKQTAMLSTLGAVTVIYQNWDSDAVVTRTVPLGLVTFGRYHLPQPPTFKQKQVVKAWLADQHNIWMQIFRIWVLENLLKVGGGLVREIVSIYM